MKGYSTLARPPELEPHHLVYFHAVPKTLVHFWQKCRDSSSDYEKKLLFVCWKLTLSHAFIFAICICSSGWGALFSEHPLFYNPFFADYRISLIPLQIKQGSTFFPTLWWIKQYCWHNVLKKKEIFKWNSLSWLNKNVSKTYHIMIFIKTIPTESVNNESLFLANISIPLFFASFHLSDTFFFFKQRPLLIVWIQLSTQT